MKTETPVNLHARIVAEAVARMKALMAADRKIAEAGR